MHISVHVSAMSTWCYNHDNMYDTCTCTCNMPWIIEENVTFTKWSYIHVTSLSCEEINTNFLE